MSKWFYHDEQGEKIEVTGGQLKWLAKNGKIAPETVVENEEGRKARAGKVKGLTFIAAAQPETETPESTTPETESPESATSAETEGYKLSQPEPPVEENKPIVPVLEEVNPFAAAPPVEANPFATTVPVEVNPFTSPVSVHSFHVPTQQVAPPQAPKPLIDIDEQTLMNMVQEEVKQPARSTPKYLFTDANGLKHLLDNQQLKTWAAQGVITPKTPLETENGRKGLAGQVPGLFPAPVQPQTVPQSVEDHVAEKSRSSLLVSLIGLVAVLVVGGIGWAIISSPSSSPSPIYLPLTFEEQMMIEDIDRMKRETERINRETERMRERQDQRERDALEEMFRQRREDQERQFEEQLQRIWDR